MPGEFICNQGEVGHKLFILCKGRARVVSRPLTMGLVRRAFDSPRPDLRAHTKSTLPPMRLTFAYLNNHELFGDVSFFLPRSKLASVQAITYCQVP